ncbi:MAG TPA: lipid II flippase MurJ [Steroidobacteraceae bacterium]|jgi:peptidoglycan biosynthesis protein MviN/MurJ (putative lipid II flippase)
MSQVPGALHAPASSTDRSHSEIVRGILSVGTFILIGKLAAAAKEMVVAWRYGVSADVDVYLFLFNLINWPISLWVSILTPILVPILAKERYERHGDQGRFRAELTGRTLLAGVVVAAVVAVLMVVLLRTSLTGLPTSSLSKAFRLLTPMVLLTPFGWLIGLFSVVMLAAGRHANTLLESVPAIVIAALAAAFGSYGIDVLAWATLAGYLCHMLALAVPLRHELQTPRYTADAPQWSAFWAGFSIMLLGQCLMSLTTVADQFFAARLSAGALASLGYAQRILALILGLGATAVGRATIPVLARAPDSAYANVRGITLRWVRIVFAGGLVAIAIGWWLAPWGVRLLFERGAFTPGDTRAVVAVLRAGLLQMPFNFSAVLLFYALAGRRKYMAITLVASVALILKLLMNSLLVPVWGTQGLMLSTGVMNAALMFMYLLLLLRENDG